MPARAPETPSALERVIRRDRWLMVFGLAATILLAWTYLVRAAATMPAMTPAMTMDAQMHAAQGMADMRSWGTSDWLRLFVMWTVMMAAMMLPSAAPRILLVLGAFRRHHHPQARVSAVTVAPGNSLAWTT